ncbi:threonyl-tRNA synthetase [Nonlabens ulvanivorans]|nr:threonyl-tRNA synthetase [Nonlabens ulvanivorans]
MPEQCTILSLSEKYENYAKQVANLLENNEIRTTVDNRAETMGKKIREAEMNKLPYMLIVGEQEEKDGTISVRKHGGDDLGSMSVETFSQLIKDEIASTIKTFEV